MNGLLAKLRTWGIPGFRTGVRWKQIAATAAYILIAYWLLQAFNGRVGLPVFALVVLTTVLLAANGWNLRSKSPVLNSANRLSVFAGWGLIALALLITSTWSLVEIAPATQTASLHQGSGGVGGGPAESLSSQTAISPTPTPTATPTPTPKPTPTPTPTPTATPTPEPAAPQTTINFVNGPLTARPGQAATLIVRTSPNTACTIEVDYKSGPSRAQGLVPKTSDAGGNVSWTWIVGTRTTPGQWPITVTCGSATDQTYINVV